MNNTGLAARLAARNNNVSNNFAQAQQSIQNGGGYNTVNIPNMVKAPISQNDYQEITQAQVNAQTKQVLNMGNLQKPNLPQNCINIEVAKLVVDKMWAIICLNNLQGFYTQETLQYYVDRACSHDWAVIKRDWGFYTFDETTEIAAVLGIYDLYFFLDDSGSMANTEINDDSMSRMKIMEEVTRTFCFYAVLMEQQGVKIRFMNKGKPPGEPEYYNNCDQIRQLFRKINASGGTPLGTELRKQYLENDIAKYIQSNSLARPVLIITLTDGHPSDGHGLEEALVYMEQLDTQSKYGSKAVEFSFVQIGTDEYAQVEWKQLWADKVIRDEVNIVHEFSEEKRLYQQAFPNDKPLTEALWITEALVGAIDPTFEGAKMKLLEEWEFGGSSNTQYQYQPQYQQTSSNVQYQPQYQQTSSNAQYQQTYPAPNSQYQQTYPAPNSQYQQTSSNNQTQQSKPPAYSYN